MSGYEYKYYPATMCFNAEHETNFAEMDMDTMKAMVSASNPSDVHDVARGWAEVYNQLVGGSAAEGSGGGGGIKKIFTAAVDEVLKDWEGDAAESFQAQAKKISKKISDGAEYARYTSVAMGNAASALERIKPEVEAMEKPGTASSAWDSATDWDRDDSGLKRDLADGNKTTEEALDGNRDDLSKGKERQLEMAVKMEQLGAAYSSQYKAMGTWQRRSKQETEEDYPGEPGGTAPVPAVLPGGPSSPKSVNAGSTNSAGKGSGYASSSGLNSPRTAGITGGVHSAPKPGSQIGTGLNGVSGGAGGGLGPGGGGGLGGGLNAGAGNPGAGPGTIGTPGIPGGGVAGGVTRGGAGAGAGTRGGRTGAPGMGGGAGAAGAGSAKGAGGRGSLARQPGGVIGAGKNKPGAGPQGGSGLHRSRGGAQAGAPGAGRGVGMAGAPGARGANENDEKARGKRPDYLVEDEETWASGRNVAPRVIE
ncbi:hypothetical protein ABZW18_20380 [Streptomyces sp. NPDC004647]|uniref:hypothetical protein n=1 Tax=Streptomyces sp. NPDC004647 TaxID=3154671 RepID=UPI0033AB7360